MHSNIIGTAVSNSRKGNISQVVLSTTPIWPESVLGLDALYVADHIYRSLDARRWAYETTHYFKPLTPNIKPLTFDELIFEQFPLMRTALFKIIKEHFFIPLSFKITETICEPKPSYDQRGQLVTIRAMATAKACEREVNKCNKCDRRYRCVTQREG